MRDGDEAGARCHIVLDLLVLLALVVVGRGGGAGQSEGCAADDAGRQDGQGDEAGRCSPAMRQLSRTPTSVSVG